MAKLKILIFANLRSERFMHFRYFLDELKRQACVQVWSKGRWEINYVLKAVKKRGNFSPDFIFHYDFAYGYALSPRIYGLSYTNIPKGVYYIDLQTQTDERREFVHENRINLVFSPTKDFFFRTLPDLKKEFRWLPFSNNPDIFKDWKLKKDIDCLLMGRSWGEWYPFRNEVLKRMKGVKGFVYHKHPYEGNVHKSETYTGERYAREINRAKIFFTCGTRFGYPVRKYFEVPACNTLLIAKGNRDLEDLGFVSGENFVECNENNFYDLAMYYLGNEEKRKRIAQNGCSLVHSRHTDRIRVREFLQMVETYLSGRKRIQY